MESPHLLRMRMDLECGWNNVRSIYHPLSMLSVLGVRPWSTKDGPRRDAAAAVRLLFAIARRVCIETVQTSEKRATLQVSKPAKRRICCVARRSQCFGSPRIEPSGTGCAGRRSRTAVACVVRWNFSVQSLRQHIGYRVDQSIGPGPSQRVDVLCAPTNGHHT